MKKILILFIMFLFYSNVFAKTENYFNDINTHWAKEEIYTLLNEGIVNGYEDNTFRPDKEITVSEFLKLLVEIADYKLETIGNRWPDWYIGTAIKNKIIITDEFNNYSKNITRYEAARIISRYINLENMKKTKNEFTDLNEENKDIVLKLASLQVINGYSDKTFKGEKTITRAEACKIIINAYKAKQEQLKKNNCEISDEVTNIYNKDEKEILNMYEIKNNRIYIYDFGRYANLDAQTLNQEYIDDKKIIKLLKTLIGQESYTELKFVPDKYIINSLNICYRKNKVDALNGAFIFEIKFYENNNYDVAKSKDNLQFTNEAVIKIRTGKMWDKYYELVQESSCSDKNIYKLKEAIGTLLGEDIKEEFVNYIVQKRIEASKIPNSNVPKISEVKKIGKYTINTFCINDKDIEIFIQKF